MAALTPRQYHTILQFRVMDYGMERCALALRLPSGEEGSSKSADIELSVLDVSRPLDPSSISWSSRPPRRNVVGTLRASADEEVRLPEFPCKWGSLYAFEASCAPDSPACDVDVWADRNGTWGTYCSLRVFTALAQFLLPRCVHVPIPNDIGCLPHSIMTV